MSENSGPVRDGVDENGNIPRYRPIHADRRQYVKNQDLSTHDRSRCLLCLFEKMKRERKEGIRSSESTVLLLSEPEEGEALRDHAETSG